MHAPSGKFPSDPCSIFQYPIRSVKFRDSLMRSSTRVARPKTWSAQTLFVPFIFHAYECCMTKRTRVRYKNCWALLTFTKKFSPLVQLQDFDKSTFCNFTLWMTNCLVCPRTLARSWPPPHIPGNSTVFASGCIPQTPLNNCNNPGMQTRKYTRMKNRNNIN